MNAVDRRASSGMALSFDGLSSQEVRWELALLLRCAQSAREKLERVRCRPCFFKERAGIIMYGSPLFLTEMNLFLL